MNLGAKPNGINVQSRAKPGGIKILSKQHHKFIENYIYKFFIVV
jgi:hypothetical protein